MNNNKKRLQEANIELVLEKIKTQKLMQKKINDALDILFKDITP